MAALQGRASLPVRATTMNHSPPLRPLPSAPPLTESQLPLAPLKTSPLFFFLHVLFYLLWCQPRFRTDSPRRSYKSPLASWSETSAVCTVTLKDESSTRGYTELVITLKVTDFSEKMSPSCLDSQNISNEAKTK